MSIFDNWQGQIEINGSKHVSIEDVNGAVSIHLMPKGFVPRETPTRTMSVPNAPSTPMDDTIWKVKVRAWMTKTGSDFIAQWNKDTPMPLRIMVGTILKETEKMYRMSLHGDILQEITQTCMCCGKPITNDVSKYFGMGPVCGQHNYINPFSSRAELKAAVASYRAKLQNIVWEGWIPKSAIESMEKWNGNETD